MSIAPEILCLALVAGLCLGLLAGFPVAFTLAGTSLVFAGAGMVFGAFDAAFLTAFPQAVFSVMSNETLVAVPLFVFMGAMLERSRVAEDLLSALGGLLGRLPGGLAIAVSGIGALLAASTGIVGATVVTMGLMSLPVMLRRGYDPAFACGSIAASGTLGQIVPPSIILILLADQLSNAYQNAQFASGVFSPDAVSVSDFFAGALLPGLMLAGLYMAYQAVYAGLSPDKAPPVPDGFGDGGAAAPLAFVLIRTLWAPLALIVAVLGSILAGIASPSEAAGIGALGALLLAAQRCDPLCRRPAGLAAASALALVVLSNFADLRMQRDTIPAGDGVAIAVALGLAVLLARGVGRALIGVWRARGEAGDGVLQGVAETTLSLSAMIFMIVIGARLFAIVFRGFGGDDIIETALGNLPGGTMGAVLAVMAVMFVMGFFLDFLEIVFIVVPVVAPVLLQMEMPGGAGMSPIWLGVMMAVNLQTSFLTPPFGFALFYLRGVAPDSVGTGDIYRGAVPFVGLQLVALGFLWFFPQIALWLPGIL